MTKKHLQPLDEDNDDDQVLAADRQQPQADEPPHKPQQQQQQQPLIPPPSFVRGVNVGGWLLLERFIVPYQFAITDCHLQGDLCWYPGQISAPPQDDPAYQVCDLYKCHPHRFPSQVDKVIDYPLDEYMLSHAFRKAGNVKAGTDWLNYHFENFITEQDVKDLAKSGLSHLRVPLPHWIMGDARADEAWIVGDRWKYFVRFCKWCRTAGIAVWPDIHTAPGSQNGFDNSGYASNVISCKGWSDTPEHVERSLQVIRDVTAAIVAEDLQDVVTGFGLLNEPFKDCNRTVYEQFLEQGMDIVRTTLGPDTAIYVSDMFQAKTFNNGKWWLDPARYNNTYLDSHYYHVFAEEPRALSPRQHIAFVCQNEYRDAVSCCYNELEHAGHINDWISLHDRTHRVESNHHKYYQPPRGSPSRGVKRLIGEWSAAVDILPVAMLLQVMNSIAETGTALYLDRVASPERQEFLQRFIEAQIVAYEAADAGVGGGWFYWTVKMEGGAFLEWDYLRAVKEGWFPKLPSQATQPSQELYGSCYDIIFKTNDDMSLVDEFPDPATLPKNNWQAVPIDDDVVVSHGESLLHINGHYVEPVHHSNHYMVWSVLIAAAFGFVVYRYWCKKCSRKGQYTELSTTEINSFSV